MIKSKDYLYILLIVIVILILIAIFYIPNIVDSKTVPSQPIIISVVAIKNPGIMVRIKTPSIFGEGYDKFTGYEFFMYNSNAPDYNSVNNYIMDSACILNYNTNSQRYDLPFNVKYIDDADNEVNSTNALEKNNQEILIKFKDPIIKSMNIGTYYIKYRVKNSSNQYSIWSNSLQLHFDGFRNKYGNNITATALRNDCYDYNWLDTNISDSCKQYIWNDVGCMGEIDTNYATNHDNSSTLKAIYNDFSTLSCKDDDESINVCKANKNNNISCLKI